MSDIIRITTPFSYSSAVRAGDYVFLGLHRGFGEGFTAQLEGALEGVKRTLAQLGLPLSNMVKVQVWLKNIEDLTEMEHCFRNYFEQDQYPARMTSTTEFIDTDCLVMIEGIVWCG